MHHPLLMHKRQAGGGGAPSPVVAISDQTIDDGLNLNAVYRLQSAGNAQKFTENAGIFENIPGEWLLSGAVADYEILYTLVSGNAPSIVAIPALSSGVWSAFNNGAQFSLGASKACNFTVSLRLASTHEVLDTATIILNTTA